jgi:hypothetical protein
LIAELYAGKITFGEFNVTIAYIDEDRASILSTVPQLTQTPPPPPASAQSNAITKSVELPPKKQPAQNAKPHIIGSKETRIALIIGNSNYSNLPKLSNPANDAKSIADTLKQLGFQTALALDASEQNLRHELRKFANDSTKASIALVFYAGHGAQVNGDNYLLPVDMEIAHTETDIQLTGLKVDDLVNSIRSNTKIVFLDACRDNPALYKNLVHGRSAGRAVGLAPTVASNLDQVKPGGGVFIAYATESGSVAEDGHGKHSPFTEALLRNLQKPISIDDIFSLVTKEVRLVTKNMQRPYKYASLESIVCLTGNCSGGTPSSDGVIDAVQDSKRSESEELQIALRTKNSDALATFLQRYPNSPKRTEVLASISTLRRSEFTEWTQFELGNQQFPWSMQLSSLRRFGTRVAVRLRFTPDPTAPLVPGRELHDAAYVENINVFDCEQPIMALSETTVYNKSAEVLHHYKWADPEYLNLGIGTVIAPGSVAATGRYIACNDDLNTPLVGKKRFAEMNFTSLSSTVAGDGEMFYAPNEREVGSDDEAEVILIIRGFKDFTLKRADGSAPDHIPSYRTEVDRVTFKCSNTSSATSKSEYYDELNNLVFINNLVHLPASDSSTTRQWSRYADYSPSATLRRILCGNDRGGPGCLNRFSASISGASAGVRLPSGVAAG